MRQVTIKYENGAEKVFNYRPKTDEEHVLKEVLIDEIYKFDFKPDDIVLNLGGHIGSFEVYASDKVAKIVTLEPCTASCERIVEHLALNGISNVRLENRAVSGHTGTLKFKEEAENGHNHVAMSTDETAKTIPCVALSEILGQYAFTKIKCDIEGGEYEAFRNVTIPETVNELWFETHLLNDAQKLAHDGFIQYIASQGFGGEIYENDPQNRTYMVHFHKNHLNRPESA